jgi:Flp pilus assembly pilin Flp
MIEYVMTWFTLTFDRRGVTALEYGLIAAVIIAVCATAFVTLGTQLNATLSTVQSEINR